METRNMNKKLIKKILKFQQNLDKLKIDFEDIITELNLTEDMAGIPNQRASKIIYLEPYLILDKDSKDKEAATLNIVRHIQGKWAHLFPDFNKVTESELLQGLNKYKRGSNTNAYYDNAKQVLSMVKENNYRFLTTNKFTKDGNEFNELNRIHDESLHMHIPCKVKVTDILKDYNNFI